ncbi:MAG: ABC transporter substrate-binding protein, partial [Chloroflexota bacterium]
MDRSQGSARVSRRRLLLLMTGTAGMVGLSACMRRDTPPPGGASQPAPTQVPAAQTKPAETKPAADAKPAAPAQPAAAPAKPAEAPEPAAAAGTPKRGGTMTALMQNDWLTFDIALNTASESTHFVIFDPLVMHERNDKGQWEFTPGLAEKWELKDKEATFWLRKGVKFHDGSDFNAEVMAWNINRWINEPKSVAKGSMGGIDWKNPTVIVDSH